MDKRKRVSLDSLLNLSTEITGKSTNQICFDKALAVRFLSDVNVILLSGPPPSIHHASTSRYTTTLLLSSSSLAPYLTFIMLALAGTQLLDHDSNSRDTISRSC